MLKTASLKCHGHKAVLLAVFFIETWGTFGLKLLAFRSRLDMSFFDLRALFKSHHQDVLERLIA
jgi:hypothetical protein